VLDKHEQPLMNVTAENMKADVDGSPASINSFVPGKPELIVVLDVSRSMKNIWNKSIAAAKQLVERADEDVAVFVFREEILDYAVGRSKSEQLISKIEKTPPGYGGTALYDTLIEIAGHVKSGTNAAIIVISDGGDDMSQHSSAATASLFQISSWPSVFALILDYDETQTHREYFKKIPAATGGLIKYPSSASKVASAVDELATVALSDYVFKLQPSRPHTKPAKLRIEVTGSDGKPRKDVKLLNVTEVPGCASEVSSDH
jgi:uncharacterized protein with von Willebrand factor type A (vWA) domain